VWQSELGTPPPHLRNEEPPPADDIPLGPGAAYTEVLSVDLIQSEWPQLITVVRECADGRSQETCCACYKYAKL
jgi:hypothetical protein